MFLSALCLTSLQRMRNTEEEEKPCFSQSATKRAEVFWHGPLGLDSLVANKVETENKVFCTDEVLVTCFPSV